MNASDIVGKVRFFQTARASIRNDRNLSDAGKARAGANLEQSISLFRGEAFGVLEREWKDARARYEDTEKMRAEAEQAEGARWDAQRLLFEQTSVERRLSGMRELKDIAEFTEKALNSGNIEHARAAAEAVPGVVRSRFPGLEGERVARAAERRLAVMLNTPELEKVKELGSMRAQAVLKLLQHTEEIAGFYQAGYLGETEFSKLLSNVRISRTYHPDEPARFERTTIEFAEPVGA